MLEPCLWVQLFDVCVGEITVVVPLRSVLLIALLQCGLVGSAVAEVTSAISNQSIQPREVDVRRARELVNYGIKHFDAQDFDEALRYFSEAALLVPQMGTPHLLMGDVYFNQRNMQRAVEEYTEVIRRDPRQFLAYVNRGSSFSALRNEGAALVDLNKAAELRPEHANTYFNRAYVFAKQGRFADALADFETADKLAPYTVLYLLGKAQILSVMDRRDEARSLYKSVLLISANNLTAVEALERLDKLAHK